MICCDGCHILRYIKCRRLSERFPLYLPACLGYYYFLLVGNPVSEVQCDGFVLMIAIGLETTIRLRFEKLLRLSTLHEE